MALFCYIKVMEFTKVLVSTTVPINNTEAMCKALGDAGAGIIGEYSYCSFSVSGNGRYKPSKNAKPHIGEAGRLEIVEEVKIEVVCNRKNALQVLA
jgi:hypothetical protein